MVARVPVALIIAALCAPAPAGAQFRRGLLAETTEITLYPHRPPVALLPAGPVALEIKNASGAPARIVERINDLIARQLTDNDARLDVVPKGGAVLVTPTLTQWSAARRNSTKYVNEQRQIGTKQVKDKNGNWKSEPVYEQGRNLPSVVISTSASLRMEVRRRSGGTPTVDDTVHHAINEEHLTRDGVPSHDEVEDRVLDQLVRKGAGRVSPGREPVGVRLARSDDVDRLNGLAQTRRWQEWLSALETVKPHRDRKRDAYRLHNMAVAQESMAYESTAPEDWAARLGLARTLIATAGAQHPTEKYITEAADRIEANSAAYRHLADLYASAGVAPPASSRRAVQEPASAPASAAAEPMSNRDVVDLRASGLDDDNLIAAVKDAAAVSFDLSPAGLKGLLAGKVSNRVISAMRARSAK